MFIEYMGTIINLDKVCVIDIVRNEIIFYFSIDQEKDDFVHSVNLDFEDEECAIAYFEWLKEKTTKEI